MDNRTLEERFDEAVDLANAMSQNDMQWVAECISLNTHKLRAYAMCKLPQVDWIESGLVAESLAQHRRHSLPESGH